MDHFHNNIELQQTSSLNENDSNEEGEEYLKNSTQNQIFLHFSNDSPLLENSFYFEENKKYTDKKYRMWELLFQPGSSADLSSGPIQRRKHTDIIFFFIFIIAIIIYIILTVQSFSNGNIKRLSTAFDYKGRICGVDEEVLNYPLLYWPSKSPRLSSSSSVLPSSKVMPVCTNECPPNFIRNRSLQCSNDTSADGYCSWYGRGGTTKVFGRFCVFRDEEGIIKTRETFGTVGVFVQETLMSLSVIAVSPLFALLLGYLILCSISLFFGKMALVTFLTSQLSLIGFGVWALLESTRIESNSYVSYLPLQLAGCTCIVLAVAACVFVYHHRSKLMMAIKIVDAAALFLSDGASFLLFTFPWTLGSLLLSLYGSVSLLSELSSNYNPLSLRGYSLWISADRPSTASIVMQVMLLSWISSTLNALCDMMVAFIVGSWYFSPLKDDIKVKREIHKAVRTAMSTILYYHVGTAAFGGLLLQTALILKALSAKIKTARKLYFVRPRVTKWLCAGMETIRITITAFVDFISRMSYIHCGLLGINFCKSAYSASSLLYRHGGVLVFLEPLGTMMRFFGEITIIIGSCAFAFILQQLLPQVTTELTSAATPLFWTAVFAAATAGTLMRMWGTVIDSVWQCYMIDTEMNSNYLNIHSTLTPSKKALQLDPLYESSLPTSPLCKTAPSLISI